MLVPFNTEDSRLNKVPKHRPRNVLILGSTGSIGISALEIIEKNRDLFSPFGLIAGTNSVELNNQIQKYSPKFAGLSDIYKSKDLKIENGSIVSGVSEICKLCAHPDVDIVLATIVGMAGIESVFAAATAGKVIALANKESLVSGGELLKKEIEKSNSVILPVDSEHSAIFQALQGENPNQIKKLILTASGGPFFTRSRADLKGITPEEAIKHPRWNMGRKISVDSATMMNKALELIEAHWLFNVDSEKIEVVVHPQSIIHSSVEFEDGSQIAQLSNPDMKGPISYALNYPRGRVVGAVKSLDLGALGRIDFVNLDQNRFPAVKMAKSVLRQGGSASAVMNSANEAAVALFLDRKLNFDCIESVVDQSIEKFASEKVINLADLIELDKRVKNNIYEENV